MSNMKKAKLALLFGAMAAAPFFASGPAFAQSAATAAQGGNGDEIVVTARRREEALQDVPLAVTTLSAAQLESIGAADITTLTRTTPNVTFEVSRGTNSTLTAFIRGVGQQDPLWGFEPGVGLYVDDVYIARPQGAILDIFDIDRLEVLRGPQGSLYGRNTIGGAIKYVTRRIGEGSEGRVRVNVGSYNQRDIVAAGSAGTDTVAFGAAIASYQRDGFGRNVVTGAEHYNKDVLAARATLEFTPTSDLFFRFAADRTEDNSNAKHGHRLLPSRNGALPVLADEFDTRAGAGDSNSVETSGLSFQAEYKLNDAVTLKSITASRTGETRTIIDFDALPQPDLDVPAFYKDEQFTQEVQALFDFGSVTGVVGVYYLNGVASGAFDTVLGSLGLSVLTTGKVSTRSVSYFGDLTWDITDAWSVSLGARQTSDDKTGTVFRQNYLGIRSPTFGNAAATAFGAPATNFRRSRSDDAFTPRLSVSYEPSDDLTLYASYSQGFKSGGFDPRANFSATPAILQPRILAGFEPEYVDSYELGLKGAFLDGRLLLNAAVFFADYTDQQVTVQQGVDTNNDGINDTIVSSVFNAGSSEYSGVEVEGTFKFSDAFRTNFSLGYISADVKEVISNGVNLQTDATPFNDFVPQNTPEWTGSLQGVYSFDAFNGGVDVTGSASYRGDYYIFNTVLNQGFGPGVVAAFPNGGPKLDADAVTLLDLSAVWTSQDGNITVGLHGKNLTDERYRVALYNFAYARSQATGAVGAPTGFDSAYSAFYGPPRTITLTAGLKF